MFFGKTFLKMRLFSKLIWDAEKKYFKTLLLLNAGSLNYDLKTRGQTCVFKTYGSIYIHSETLQVIFRFLIVFVWIRLSIISGCLWPTSLSVCVCLCARFGSAQPSVTPLLEFVWSGKIPSSSVVLDKISLLSWGLLASVWMLEWLSEYMCVCGWTANET